MRKVLTILTVLALSMSSFSSVTQARFSGCNSRSTNTIQDIPPSPVDRPSPGGVGC